MPTRDDMLFLSYAHDDGAPIARRLARALEAQGIDVWFDLERIGSGEKWSEAIERALDASNGMVVVVTTSYVNKTSEEEAERVRLELGHAITSPEYAGRVFPVWSADVEPSHAPSALGYLQGFDLGSEPPEEIASRLAARLRRS